MSNKKQEPLEKILVRTLGISWREANARVQAAKKELGYPKTGTLSSDERIRVIEKACAFPTPPIQQSRAVSPKRAARARLEREMQAFRAQKERERKRAWEKEQAQEARIMERMLAEGPVESAISDVFYAIMQDPNPLLGFRVDKYGKRIG
mmetsp:Transcript_3401/g.6512  ORF Transcript_3401/g.6512 Transcript_3401/m.6512 type:complete len:150 (-) Transcript_3401:101-550(-)|eukprot:scaffold34948_cov122-Amphora_coffeaeformis.AAC.1